MHFTVYLVVGLAFALTALRQSHQADCNGCCSQGNYREINEPRRSIKSTWKPGQVALCDRALLWGWYRFTSYVGGKMPTSVVDPKHCGTIAPIWLRTSTHPQNDAKVTVKACVNLFNVNGGCAQSFDVDIKDCAGNFFLYYLRPTYSCSLAYCAGDIKPCPYGQLATASGVCYDPPTPFNRFYLGEPQIIWESDIGTPNINLRCDVPLRKVGLSSLRNVSYRIAWYSEGKHLYTEYPCGPLPPNSNMYDDPCPGPNKPMFSRLNSSHYSLQRWISCNVSAKYTHPKSNPWCLPKSVRQPFFVGIKVEPSTLTLTECSGKQHKKITITPTIPVKKDQFFRRDYLSISFSLPRGLSLFNAHQCKVILSELTPVEVTIVADCKSYPADSPDTFIMPEIEGTHSVFWNSVHKLPSVWITVVGRSDKVQRCQTYTDPHYLSFGGQYFTFMGHGDFVLYKNTKRYFEVHTRQWFCSNNADTCNCGAVLRDHNDVIEFNCCNKNLHYDQTTPVRVKVRSKKRLAPGISVTQTIDGFNSNYIVLFPSGAKVTIYRNSYGLNIFLQVVRAESINDESGLCLYDGSNTNVDTFGYKMRLHFGKSYFDTLPAPLPSGVGLMYNISCSCHRKDNKGNPECISSLPVHFPNIIDKKGNVVTFPRANNGGRRKRGIYYYSDDLTEEDFDLFKSYLESGGHHRYKRAVLNKPRFTKENATLYCMEKVSNTEVGKFCASLGANVQAKVNSCSVDLELTGETSFAISAVSMLLTECGEIAGRNLSSILNESSGEKRENSSILSGIAERLCPNDCTFKGRCINGSCICNKGYTANDCAVSTEQIPYISMLQGNGLCDRRQRPCRKVTVMGNGFLNSTNLTCHVVEFKVTSGSWTPNNTELLFPGIMTDLVLVDCYLPQSPVMHGYFDAFVEGTPAAGLRISVSNDGEHKSDKNLTFISYDSACMSCNVSSGCYVKSDACVINRYCFAPNEINPNDWCYQCLPDFSKSTWTKRQVNLPPQFSSTTKYFALLQEYLELTIDVSDPEDMPVTVSLLNGSPSKAEIRENVLLWNTTNDAKTDFFLKATDACNASSTLDISVSLVVCQCQNNGRCVPHRNKPRGSGYYECHCLPGFTGDNCETNIDECLSYPCYRGRCIDGVDNFTCACYSGFVGRKCEINYDDCSTSPCIHGNCTDYVGAYGCSCEPGYTGKNCTIDIDECKSSPCQNGWCVDLPNNYSCVCQNGYTDYDCDVDIDECQSFPCVHGTCLDKINDFSCNCPAGFTGKMCEVDIDDCGPSPCVNGICIDHINKYTCNCHVGFTGPHCDVKIKNCASDSCYPNVTCFKNGDNISCGPCPFGFSGDGKNCKDIDYCLNHTCDNGGTCVDGISTYSCNCIMGFTGVNCETDINHCANRTCHNGGSCVDGVINYSCNCVAGFTGDHCETNINECVNNTCQNGGSCVDGVSNYSCNCLPGFTGYHCETDIDECINHTCSNGGSCIDGVNSYSCDCQPGFTGDRCQTDINECVNNTCQNGGSCVDGVNKYSCSCLPGFTGYHCETDIDECVNHTCSNGGTCMDGVNNYSCNCQSGFAGDRCQAVTPSSDEGRKTTGHPPTENLKTELIVKLHIEMEWNDDLDDHSSAAFKELSRVFKEEIREQYSQDDNFVEVEVLSFKMGSVVAEFKLTFETKLKDEEALAPLKEGIQDGKMGSLSVDPESLEVKKEEKAPTKQQFPFKVVIGVSSGSFFILVFITVSLVCHCQRRREAKQRRFIDGMPKDVAFPRPENYELEDQKQDVARYEEVPILAIGIRYKGLGVANEAAYFEGVNVSKDADQSAGIGISNEAVHDGEIGILNKDMQ